jgi:hypothetical protein
VAGGRHSSSDSTDDRSLPILNRFVAELQTRGQVLQIDLVLQLHLSHRLRVEGRDRHRHVEDVLLDPLGRYDECIAKSRVHLEVNRDFPARRHLDSLARGLEPFGGRRDRVGAGRDAGDPESAVRVGGGALPLDAAVRALEPDDHARERFTVGVNDPS